VLTGLVATANPHRRDYFKPHFFNGIAPQLPFPIAVGMALC
jgi:hypothetical protein